MAFQAHGLTADHLNEIIRKLGGEEGARKFLRDELAIVSSRPRTLLPIWRTLKLGTYRSGEEYARALSSQPKMELGTRAREMLAHREFTCAQDETEVDIVIVTVSQLSFPDEGPSYDPMGVGASYQNICLRASECGLELCPAEVGPALRLTFIEQRNYDDLIIPMKGQKMFHSWCKSWGVQSLEASSVDLRAVHPLGAEFAFVQPKQAEPVVFQEHDLTSGQLDEIIWKLGGEEGAGKFLRDEFTTVPRTLPIWRTLKLGTYRSGEEYARALSSQPKMEIDRWAREMLADNEFTCAQEEAEVDIVAFTIRQLGFPQGANYQDICLRACECGLELCPAEVGPALRLTYAEQPKRNRLFIAMKGKSTFRLECHELGTTYLRGGTHSSMRGRMVYHIIPPSFEFAFVRPKQPEPVILRGDHRHVSEP